MKKIMFNDRFGLTQAVLEGRKTMTRRALTDRKLHYWEHSCPNMVIVKVPESNKIKLGDDNTYFGIKEKISDGYYCDTIVSPYKVGEVVAIAQSYLDLSLAEVSQWKSNGNKTTINSLAGWTNKMFVKADLMPHHIEITGIKVERLQDVSDEDCLKEGIEEHLKGGQYGFPSNIGYIGQYPFSNAREAFAALIDKVSGKGTWDSNPFVWAYEFELID